MKHIITKSVLALGASGVMLLAQSTPPQSPQQRTPRSSDPSSQTTPSGQTGSQASDSQMAAKVRQALMDDQTVGTTAHNVRVTSHNGMITLKGKVNSEQEKDAIVSKAKQVAGDSNIKDDITVAKQK
jgi:osmotically-inducible protein OsmY